MAVSQSDHCYYHHPYYRKIVHKLGRGYWSYSSLCPETPHGVLTINSLLNLFKPIEKHLSFRNFVSTKRRFGKKFFIADPSSSIMQKQVLVTKEYIVNYPKQTQNAVAKAKKRTLLPTDLVTKVVIVEGGTQCFLTASELAEILDMQVGNHTNRTRTAQLHWRENSRGKPYPQDVFVNIEPESNNNTAVPHSLEISTVKWSPHFLDEHQKYDYAWNIA